MNLAEYTRRKETIAWLACILILAPEIRRGLFDRLGRRPAPAAERGGGAGSA